MKTNNPKTKVQQAVIQTQPPQESIWDAFFRYSHLEQTEKPRVVGQELVGAAR